MDCNFPLTIQNPKTKQWMKVPCGKCMACRIARVRDWSVRLLDECSVWEDTSFITLTYSEENLPRGNCGKPTLVKRDLQNFFKRLRKNLHQYKYRNEVAYSVAYDEYQEYLSTRDTSIDLEDDPDRIYSPPLLRYFACGEMGDHTGRPHYHAIVFGLSPLLDDLVLKSWKLGHITVESVNIQRIKYVCGYVEKKMYYNPRDNLTLGYGCQQPPFQLMSQGLGLSHFDAHEDDYIWSQRKTVNGIAYSFPRYYLKKHEDFKFLMSFKGERARMITMQNEQDAIDEGRSLYDSRLQREMDLRAKSKLKKGSI